MSPRLKHSPPERGSALVTAIALVFLLAAAGIVLLRLAQGETVMNVADHQGKQAFFLADAAIEQGREQLRLYRKTTGLINIVPKLTAAAGGNALLDARPQNLTIAFNSAGVPTLSGYGDDVPYVPLSAVGDGWYAALLNNDVVENPNGRSNATTDVNKRIMLIGVGIGRGRAVEMSEAVIDTGPDMPVPPATITVLGDAPQFDSGSSSVKQYFGDDCRATTLPSGTSWVSQGSFDVVGVTSAAALTTVQDDINGQSAAKQAGFQTGTTVGPYREGAATAANVTTSPYYSSYPEFQNCTDMVALGQRIRGLANTILPDDSEPTQAQIGTITDPQIVFCDGDCELTGSLIGYGVLWVKGDLSLNGGISWYGPIYVIGTGQLFRKGAGGGDVYGSIIIANTMNGACNGPSAGGYGTGAQYDMSGAGSSTTAYCSYYNQLAWAASPLRVRSFRQR